MRMKESSKQILWLTNDFHVVYPIYNIFLCFPCLWVWLHVSNDCSPSVITLRRRRKESNQPTKRRQCYLDGVTFFEM